MQSGVQIPHGLVNEESGVNAGVPAQVADGL